MSAPVPSYNVHFGEFITIILKLAESKPDFLTKELPLATKSQADKSYRYTKQEIVLLPMI